VADSVVEGICVSLTVELPAVLVPTNEVIDSFSRFVGVGFGAFVVGEPPSCLRIGASAAATAILKNRQRQSRELAPEYPDILIVRCTTFSGDVGVIELKASKGLDEKQHYSN